MLYYVLVVDRRLPLLAQKIPLYIIDYS